MGLGDFANIFSRAFIVGYFVPAFVALFGIDHITTDGFMPASYRDESGGVQIVVLGVAALVIGIVLSALNYVILRLFEGYPFNAGHRLELVGRRRRRHWQQKYDEFQAAKERDAESEDRTRAALQLNERFPAKRENILPTRFGNALRSFETYPRHRYGLAGVAIWPRIEMLLSDAERQMIDDARGTVAFFVNGCMGSITVGLVVSIDATANTGGQELTLRVLLAVTGGSALAWLCYLGAVVAVVNWGSSIRAAFDLYRFQLLERIGVKIPKTEADEATISKAVNRFILFGEEITDELRQPPTPQGAP